MNSLDNSQIQPGQQVASASKPLWVAVGILGFAVLAMGGTMIYQMRNPVTATPVALAAPQATPQVSTPMAAASNAADDLVEKPAVQAKPAPVPAPAKKVVVKPVPKPVPVPAYAGAAPAPYVYPAPAPVAAICTVCGSVESVTPFERSAKPSGVGIGTVAGGVLGAVLGNQIGHGGGRTAATILGAVGGGFAGNAIEGHVRKETVYQVSVRMEDGSRRTVEVAQPPQVGSRVTVEGSVIRSRDGAVYAPRPQAAPVARQAEPSPYYSGH